MITINKNEKLHKLVEQKLPVGNIYKIIKGERFNEFVIGAGEGVFSWILMHKTISLYNQVKRFLTANTLLKFSALVIHST